MQIDTEAQVPVRLSVPTIVFMALAAALGTSTIYPMQPAITTVAESLDTDVASIGLALAGGPVGYMLGLALLVPLVDRLPPGRVLAAQFGVLALGLAVSAAAGTVTLLGAVMVVVGACSSVGAGLSSFAGRLAPAGRRATVLGTVTAGISVGILAGRIVGGWLTDELGWRAMLLVLAAACGVIAMGCVLVLPHATAAGERGYLASLRSVPGLIVGHPVLRAAALRGSLWFFAFCTVWAGIAVALSEPPYSLPAEQIGLYALAGLSGLLSTQVAGRWADRVGARRVIVVGLSLAGAAAVAVGFSLSNTVVTLICLAIFDAGLFAAQVANQSTVLAIDPAAPARFNSAYMLVYFVGGSIGTACGVAAVEWFGWPMTALVAAAAIGLAATSGGRTPRAGRARRRAGRCGA
ncbi:Predicted arabinose efflux permease, MFS family [Nocardioides sp. YR527]|uniref:MFS transporter n=1 Tax=Nocardioides sp. YR527 TaxID=1881028 RepID=UPI00088772E9|nr:MFS transporter [Nocardioides sp. YR527]SDK99986.1 Predicted arabinose efflux permease, MFS family [Nocardioides sp. YR527]